MYAIVLLAEGPLGDENEPGTEQAREDLKDTLALLRDAGAETHGHLIAADPAAVLPGAGR